MDYMIYGRVPALYQLKQESKAKKALREATDFLPLMAKKLIKSRH